MLEVVSRNCWGVSSICLRDGISYRASTPSWSYILSQHSLLHSQTDCASFSGQKPNGSGWHCKPVHRRGGFRIRAETGPGDLHIPLPFKPEDPCETCLGSGWLICDFCRGEKVNIQVKKKLYRRCPSCRAAGVLMCPRCKVLRCVTFPEGSDGSLPA